MGKVRRVMLMVLGILVLIWIASPIPEATILFSLIMGYLGYGMLHLNVWQTVLFCAIGYVAGSLIVWKLHLTSKIRKLVKLKKGENDG